MAKIAVITYDYRHLKTEQIIHNLCVYEGLTPDVFALPFIKRVSRSPLYSHRPNMSDGIHSELICRKFNLRYQRIASDLFLPDGYDYYLILGAGIISPECVEGKNILNIHPGIIPAARGLDSFKWSILNRIPVGNTIHYIDEGVDSGRIIARIRTPVYKTDSFESLAQRNYNFEIMIMSKFLSYLNDMDVDGFEYIKYGDGPAMRRMGLDAEKEMIECFPEYLEIFGG